jgi:hypothetical protein
MKRPTLGWFLAMGRRKADAGDQQGHPEGRTIIDKGVFSGRNWQLYSDGTLEGETVLGMERFRDLEHFKSFLEFSPALRAAALSKQHLEEISSHPTEPAPVVQADAVTAETASADYAQTMKTPDLEKTIYSNPDAELARTLVMAGGLGIILCLIWWFRFYIFGDLSTELLKRGMPQSLIRLLSIGPGHYVSCFFFDSEPCIFIKTWGRWAGYIVYEPAFLWVSVFVLGLGFLMLPRGGKTASARL